MLKYKLTIIELVEETSVARPSETYQKENKIYEQVLEHLDVSKVVIAANECIALAKAGTN